MIRNRTIVCVSSIDWDFLWQAHQAIMSALAESGNRVLFIENTGVRSPGRRDIPRVVRRLGRWISGHGRFRQISENLFLFSPLALPYPYSPVAQRINRSIVCSQVCRWLDRHSSGRPILFSFLPTQFTLDLMEMISPLLTIYYCAANFAESSPGARRVGSYETTVVRKADLVFATGNALFDQCRRYNANVHLFPIGVSMEAFDRVWETDHSPPADIACIQQPMIGYVGGLHRFVDQELMRDVCNGMPDSHFVFVGPVQTDVTKLRSLPNVHLLGFRAHSDIPAYINQFKVCLIPYSIDSFTQTVAPAKLNEYLALGKPVVSSPLPEVNRFNRENGCVVATAQGADEFHATILDMICQDTREKQLIRRSVAQQHSWFHKVEAMSQLMEEKLTQRSSLIARM